MILRSAELKDANSIAAIHIESWYAVYSGIIPEKILENLNLENRIISWRSILSDENSLVFVSEIRNKIIGFCRVVPSRDSDIIMVDTAEISAIYFSPKLWRRGFGRSLCNYVLNELSLRHYSCVTLWVLERNDGAQRFYKAMGFKLDGATNVYKETGLVKVRYMKKL